MNKNFYSQSATKITLPEFNREFAAATPADKFGEISLTQTSKEVIEKFCQAAGEGKADDYLEQLLINNSYSEIFEVKGDPATNAYAKNHSLEQLASSRQKLEALIPKIERLEEFGELTNFVKLLYRERIANQLEFLEMAGDITTPEFTLKQHSASDWKKYVDVAASEKQGEICFPYEKQAWQMLESESSNNLHNVAQALKFWNFSDAEKSQFDTYDQLADQEKLGAKEIVTVATILKNRFPELTNWQVALSEKVSAMTVNSKSRTLLMPVARKMSGDELIFNIGHEFQHIHRGENGRRFGIDALYHDSSNQLDTEEGLTVMVEMILGEPFGHIRQQEFAVRYLIGAELAKAAIDHQTGKRRPKSSVQEVFNHFKEQGVDVGTLGPNIWRALRGTSLRREVVDLPVGKTTIPMVETFVKDMCYFRGQETMYQAMQEHMNYHCDNPQFERFSLNQHDFNQKLLVRLGACGRNIQGLTLGEMKELYYQWIEQGKQVLLAQLDNFSVGKLSLSELQQHGADLHRYAQENGIQLMTYGRIFQPRTTT